MSGLRADLLQNGMDITWTQSEARQAARVRSPYELDRFLGSLLVTYPAYVAEVVRHFAIMNEMKQAQLTNMNSHLGIHFRTMVALRAPQRLDGHADGGE